MPYKWKSLATICFSVYLVGMDVSIVNIALPTLSREFSVGPDTVVWVNLIFNLSSTGIALTAGRLGDLFGRKRIFLIGWAVSCAGLALCAAAPTFALLLVARTVLTVGVALGLSTSTALVAEIFPQAQRGQAMGIYSAVVGAGLGSGPVLGGLLVDVFDWRAIFWARIPAALLLLVLVSRVVRESGFRAEHRSVDVRGALTLFAGLSAAVVACNRGPSWGWDSPAILVLAAVAVAGLTAFIWIEQRVPAPVLDLRLFRNRLFSASLLALTLSFAGQTAATFLVPFYLIQVRDYSAREAGLLMAIVPAMMLSLAPLSGWLFDRHGSRLQVSAGPLLGCAGLALLSLVERDTPLVLVMVPLAITGVGQALFSSPNTTGVLGSVPPAHMGAASGALTTARSLGGILGLTLASAVFVAVAANSAGLPVSGVRAENLPAAAQLDGIHVALRVAAAVGFFAIVASLIRPPRAADATEPLPATA